MGGTELLSELQVYIRHQKRWRRIMSGSYFTMTAMGILASTAATVVAALGASEPAALLAAVATVAFGLEKGLLFREKWAHHRNSSLQLEALRLQLLHGGLSPPKAVQRLTDILTSYGENLPVAPRDDHSLHTEAT